MLQLWAAAFMIAEMRRLSFSSLSCVGFEAGLGQYFNIPSLHTPCQLPDFAQYTYSVAVLLDMTNGLTS